MASFFDGTHLVGQLKDGGGDTQHGPPLLRKGHAVGRPVKDGKTQLLLQRLQLVADMGLGGEQVAGSLGDGVGPLNLEHVLDLLELHSPYLLTQPYTK